MKKAELIKNGNLNLAPIVVPGVHELSKETAGVMTEIELKEVELFWKYQKLMGKYQRLLGQYMGMLDGITAWDIPQELQIILRRKLDELKKENPD